jgi:predicted enzyme related to lactoylglutathione lyase
MVVKIVNKIRGELVMKILKKLVRIYVNDLDSAITFYEKLTNHIVDMRFEMPLYNLELASIDDLLLISGKEEDLEPFKQTKVTFLVDSIDEFKDFLENSGSTIIRKPSKVPTGKNMTVKHPDGLVAEYVEHN